MHADLFDFNFHHWEIFFLSLLPALINLGIFVYVFFFIPQNRTNIYFALFVFFLGLGQLIDGFVQLSNTAETALQWVWISTTVWLFIMPFGLLFTLRFIGEKKKLKNPVIQAAIFFPSVFFALLTILHQGSYKIIRSEKWHWIANPAPDLITVSMLTWICIQTTVILCLLWAFYFKKRKTAEEKSSALLLAAGFSVPFIGGIIGDVFFPLVFGLDDVPVVTTLITIFSIASFVAIKKHNLLDYSPRHQWEQILETIQEGVLIVDSHDRIMYANKTFCSTLGYTFKELHGKIAMDFLIDDKIDRQKVEAALEERQNNKSGAYELQLKTKTGKKIWVLMNGSPYRSRKGHIIGSIGISTNIDYLKKTQQDILESKGRLDRFINESMLSIHIMDPKTRKIIFANPAYHQLLGYTPEDLETLELYDFINHSRENIDERLESVSKREKLDIGKREWKTRDGKIIHVLVSSIYQKNSDGSEAIYITAQDITPIVEAENKLIASNNELEFYIYRASHDLRAPLASILGLINISRMDVSDPKGLEYIAKIETSAQKLDYMLSTLVKSMVVRNTVESDNIINMDDVISDILATFDQRLSTSGLIVNYSVMLQSPFVSNKFLIETILQNLIDNSIKYRDTGKKLSYLDIRVEENADHVSFYFTDNGIGIDQNIQDKIFDMYFRGTQISSGSGLGLYLIRKTVEKLGGEIKLKSSPGNGVAITILLPKNRNGFGDSTGYMSQDLIA